MRNYIFVVMLALLLLVGTAEAKLTPQWIENVRRHLSYSMVFWWMPFMSRFWAISAFAYSYIFMMSGFGQQQVVVDFFNDLAMVYLPMSGVLDATL